MLSQTQKESFLSLIRLSIGHSTNYLSCDYDWRAIEELSSKHGLSAVIIDGIEKLPDSKRPSKEVLLNWIGTVLQAYEYRFEQYRKSIAEIAAFYNSHGYKMMLLKGYACSLDWPKPEHRPCGDIDIWLFGKQKEADALLAKEKGIEIDDSHQHHSVFTWRDFSVENHYDFINVHHHKSNVSFERILKNLGQDYTHFIELNGEKVYLPSPNLQALFLLKHNMIHFAAEGLNLRQLLDWAFFVNNHGEEVDWEWIEEILEEYGMKKLYDVFNAICVGDLGFDVSLFPKVQFIPELKDRVIEEILIPEYSVEVPRGLSKRIYFKIRRWKANEWKHRLCYKDSMWSAFWSGIWNHIQKPSSI